MTTVTLGPIFARPLHPQSWQRPPGNKDYRITNGFDGPDYLNGGKHRATDAGNFGVNEPLRAPAKCLARGLRHFDGALGVEMDLGGEVTIALWHLNRVDIPTGAKVPLRRGDRVGLTGNTGAKMPDGSSMPAHTHIRAERDGVPFDVEPYLFGKPLTLEDDDVKIPAGLRPFQMARLGAGNRIRVDPSTTEGSRVLEEDERVHVYGIVDRPGSPWTLGTQTGTTWYYVGLKREAGYVATALLPDVNPTAVGLEVVDYPKADCSAQDNQIARAQTAVDGAAQAIAVAQEALA